MGMHKSNMVFEVVGTRSKEGRGAVTHNWGWRARALKAFPFFVLPSNRKGGYSHPPLPFFCMVSRISPFDIAVNSVRAYIPFFCLRFVSALSLLLSLFLFS
ncbi:hypothetical protein TWF225_004319 [Orbilia oligospora]|nr:hypothetical protein TWF225_004319 [Orbilia oligospora]KAF3259959.1 hypothetical protein TWF217_004988 [Orbilia oligospora]KAF3267041.1 hypothetical protein TWF128_010002 [Orbilia oligospora]